MKNLLPTSRHFFGGSLLDEDGKVIPQTFCKVAPIFVLICGQVDDRKEDQQTNDRQPKVTFEGKHELRMERQLKFSCEF